MFMRLGGRMAGFLAAVLAAMLLLAAITGARAAAETRIALVVGNGAYAHAGHLPNPPNDARDIAKMLEGLGFEVILGIDLDGPAFADTLAAFSARVTNADVALFYYSGHGLQFQEENYLLPVDAVLANQFALRRETVPLNQVLAQMESARISLAFIDACRNNPLSDELKRSMASLGRAVSVGRGLAPIELKGRDMLVAFAAAPGEVALDGSGRNSPFTTAILEHLPTPDVEISTVLKRVTQSVRAQTNGAQQPEQLASMATEFYMRATPPADAVPTVAGPAADADLAAETLAFTAALKIDTAIAWQSFLEQFPRGRYAGLAAEALRQATEAPAKVADIAPEPVPAPGPAPDIAATRALVARAMTDGDYKEAARLTADLAATGDATALGDLAYFYSEGQGVKRDKARAVELFEQAVALGNPIASYNYGWLYDRGSGVGKDSGRAAELILGALASGDAAARASLLDVLMADARQLSSDTRRAIQRLLGEAGVYSGALDGSFGAGTRRALAAFAAQ